MIIEKTDNQVDPVTAARNERINKAVPDQLQLGEGAQILNVPEAIETLKKYDPIIFRGHARIIGMEKRDVQPYSFQSS